jgi:hypothetical protein
LYWVTSSKSRLLPAVKQFLEHAIIAGVNAVVVESKTFDELAGDVIAQAKLPDCLRNHVDLHKVAERLQPVVPLAAEALSFPVLRYSAILVEKLPAEARRLSLNRPLTTEDARRLLKDQKCRAVVAARGKELAIFGRDEEVLKVFAEYGAKLEGTIALNPERDSWALGLQYDALIRALARKRPLLPRFKHNGHVLVVAGQREEDSDELRRRKNEELAKLKAAYGSLTGQVPGLGYGFAEGICLKLEKVQDRWWCGFEPSTFVDIPREVKANPENDTSDELGRPAVRTLDPSADWRRERWARKYNSNWAQIIEAWAGLLTSCKDNSVSALGLQAGEGVDAVFKVSPVTGWSRPSHTHQYFNRSK